MKISQPSFNIIKNSNQLKTVEYCARLCYKSEQLVTDDSYIKFCKTRFSEGHLAIFEHANFVFKIKSPIEFFKIIENLYGVKYKFVNEDLIVVLNLRHILELATLYKCKSFYNKLPNLYKIFDIDTTEDIVCDCELFNCDEDFCKFITIALDVQRSVWDELARHRANALCCESSRYCNYSKDKFGGEITFSAPYWYKGDVPPEQYVTYMKEFNLRYMCEEAEVSYKKLIQDGFKPQDARFILPLGYRVNCVITASLQQWKHIIELRTSQAAHPDMKKIMDEIKKEILI